MALPVAALSKLYLVHFRQGSNWSCHHQDDDSTAKCGVEWYSQHTGAVHQAYPILDSTSTVQRHAVAQSRGQDCSFL